MMMMMMIILEFIYFVLKYCKQFRMYFPVGRDHTIIKEELAFFFFRSQTSICFTIKTKC